MTHPVLSTFGQLPQGRLVRQTDSRLRGEGVQRMPFLFFLSYCGDDGRGGYVSEFYDDLRDEIRRRTTEPEEDIGFQYVGMQEGTLWRDAVSDEPRHLSSVCASLLAALLPRPVLRTGMGDLRRAAATLRAATRPTPRN